MIRVEFDIFASDDAARQANFGRCIPGFNC